MNQGLRKPFLKQYLMNVEDQYWTYEKMSRKPNVEDPLCCEIAMQVDHGLYHPYAEKRKENSYQVALWPVQPFGSK